MDKYEFNIKVEQIKKLINKSDYETAMKIADTIDWRRVRNVNILSMVAGIYEKNGEFQEAKDILLLAFERAPIGKRLLYKLSELALKEGSIEEAEDYYKEFCDLAADDARQYILRYMILKAKGAPAEQLIHTLEQYCNAELDKIMLMFGLGKYVDKAMELKLQYAPLNKYQMDLVENKDKYEAKLKAVEQEYRQGTSFVQPVENTDRRQLDREEEAEDEMVYAEETQDQDAGYEQEYPEKEEPEEYEEEFTEEPVREPAVTIQEDDVTEEEPTSEKAEAGEDREVVSEEEQVSEDEAIYETAAADEDIRARFHEAQAQENLAREMSKLSVTAMEEDIPEDEMAQTRALADIREIRKGPVYTGSNHLMIEAEVPEKGLELAIEALRKVHKETGVKNQAAKISGEKLNRRGVFALADKLTGKDLIIEKAGDMTEAILQELNQLMARDETGMNVVLIDTAKRLEELHRVYPGLAKRFECIGTSDSIKAKKAEKQPVKAAEPVREMKPAAAVKPQAPAAKIPEATKKNCWDKAGCKTSSTTGKETGCKSTGSETSGTGAGSKRTKASGRRAKRSGNGY